MFKDRETAFAFITHCTKYTASFFLHSIKNRSNLKEWIYVIKLNDDDNTK